MSREGHFFSGAVNPIITNSTLTSVTGDYNYHLHTSTSEHFDTTLQRGLEIIKNTRLADKIERWLSAPDSSRNYNEACKKHQKDTFSWFLDGVRFREWEEMADFLWIKGTAGCGKTILCSSIISKIIELYKKDKSNCYGYFFFDGRDSQSDLQQHDKLIRSLIWQLALQCHGIPAPLAKLHEDCHGHQQPSTTALQNTLHRIIDGLDSVYIVIDSLDECTDRKETLQWIGDILSQNIDNLHMVVASRPERDIIDRLKLLNPRCVNLAAEVKQDIVRYLDQQLLLVKNWGDDIQDVVKSTLTERAEGMFRWVALQLMELKKCSNQEALIQCLKRLPKDLYETYDRILSKIDVGDHSDTKAFLQWLCFSVHPMRLEEMAESVAIHFDAESGPRYMASRRYWDKRDVLDKCSGLIAESEGMIEFDIVHEYMLTNVTGKIKLAHFSIKEYLLSERLNSAISSFRLTEELSHAFISQTCLAYLLQFDTSDSVYQGMVRTYPLAPYAAQNWIFHARSGGIDKYAQSLTLTLAKMLFTPEGDTFRNWVRMWDLDLDERYTYFRENSNKTYFAAPLYYAALGGLQQVSQHLSEGGYLNARGGRYGSALQAAIHKKHEGIVKLLVENGANMEIFVQVTSRSSGDETFNALQAASYRGHKEIVRLLLEKRADVNAQGGSYGNALKAASYHGHEEVVELLLENEADVNAQGGGYGNALHRASYWGRGTIVKLLLKNGADVNAQGGKYGTALQNASYEGYKGIVKLLLENGADVNALGGMYGNALQAASYAGYKGIVKLLLENGADVNALGGRYGNALQAARSKGYEAIATLLLENGADVDNVW